MARTSFRRLFRFPAAEADVRGDVEQEIAFHLQARIAELTAHGLSSDAARAQAMAEFGDVDRARADLEAIGRRRLRNRRRADWRDDLRQDLRYGVRALRRAPLFATLAIVTLALGIGANAAIFSVLKSVVIDPLPYADAGALVRVFANYPNQPGQRGPLSAATIDGIRARQRSFSGLAAFTDLPAEAAYGGSDGARTTTMAWVEPDFFHTLGVDAALGRTFRADEGISGLAPLSGGQLVPDTAAVVVASDRAWQRLLGGAPSVIGRSVRIDGVLRTVVGVLPRGFVGPLIYDPDFYVPMDLRPVIAHPVAGRRAYWLSLIGRLEPGRTADAAQKDLAGIQHELAREFPEANGTMALRSLPLRDSMLGPARQPLLALMASAGLVLLLTCANLASALLSRTLSRRKEFAVRLALGAGRGRLARQLLTESLVLAGAGGVTGLLLSAFVLGLARTVAGPALPVHARLALDGGAVLVTAAVALGAGLLFGVAPAFSIRGSGARVSLREESRAAGEGRGARRLRGALVAGQIAVCVSLLAAAGLLTRSLWAMTSTPLGIDPDGVLTLSLRLPQRDYPTPDAIGRFHERLLDEVRSLPGIEAAASASAIPASVFRRQGFTIDGAPPAPGNRQPVFLYAMVSDDYFRTLRIPIRAGRVFDNRDRSASMPTVVISESTARRYWPDGRALGARIRLGPEVAEVVGIVGDVRNDPARRDAEPMGYRSMRQMPSLLASLMVRTHGDPLTAVPSITRAVSTLDRGIPLERSTTLRAAIGEGLAARRLSVALLAAFAVFALLLASVGVYAMFANLIAAREREFGVRLALGSGRSAIAALVFRQGAGWMAAGLTAGAIGIALVAGAIRDLLYDVPAFDPVALGGAVLVLVASATIAMMVPLRRAARLDPAETLRAQ